MKVNQNEFEQAIRELGMSLIDNFYQGVYNERKLKISEQVIKIYEALKSNQPTKKS